MITRNQVKALTLLSLSIIGLAYMLQSMNDIQGQDMTITTTRRIVEYETTTTTRTTPKISTSTDTLTETTTRTRTRVTTITSTTTETLDLRSTTTQYHPIIETYTTTFFESPSPSLTQTSPSPTQTTPSQTPSTPFFGSMTLGIIIVIIIVILIALAFKFKKKKPTGQSLTPSELTKRFCINCGEPISTKVTHCPYCREKQE